MDDDLDDEFSLNSHRRPRSASRSNDVAVTFALLVLVILVGIVFSSFVIIQLMGTDSCAGRPGECDFALLGTTTYVTPVAVVLVAVATTIGLIARTRTAVRSWWIPLLGLIVVVSAFALASGLVSAGLGI